VTPSIAAFYRCAFAVPPLLLLTVLERRRGGGGGGGDARTVGLAWLAGAFLAADLVLWHHAIGLVGAGLGTVLANVQVVLVPIVAWLVLSERPAWRVVAAVPIVLGGVVLISGVVGEDAYGTDPVLGVVLGLLTAVAYAGFLLALRAASTGSQRVAWTMLHVTISCAVGVLPAGWLLGELDFRVSAEALAWLVALALSAQVLGWLLIASALPRAPAALSSVLLTMQPVAAVLLAIVLVDESPSAVQLAGVAIVVAGIVLVTGRRRVPPLT